MPARVRCADEAATEPLIGPPAWTLMPSVEHVFTRLAQVGCQRMFSTSLVGLAGTRDHRGWVWCGCQVCDVPRVRAVVLAGDDVPLPWSLDRGLE
jgi:hypothetical protein